MAFHTQGFASSSQHTAHLLSATLHLKVQTHLKMNVSPSYVAPIIPPISHHGWFQILVLAHTHCVVSQYKSSQRHPSTFTKPSQNDCLIILDTPSIPPIRCHRSTQILALAHPFSLPFKYKSSQRHPSKSTKPSQNDCLIILDTPSIPPISPHRPTQILALAHPFSLPFKYKSSQRHPSKSTNPSQNECFIKRHTPSIPPISLHVPWNATHPTLKSPHFTHLPSIHPIRIPSHTTYTTLTPHLLFSLAEISICVRVRARNTHFDPFTKLNLNSSLDRANSNTYNPWEMISRLQTIAQTVPFDSLFYT